MPDFGKNDILHIVFKWEFDQIRNIFWMQKYSLKILISDRFFFVQFLKIKPLESDIFVFFSTIFKNNQILEKKDILNIAYKCEFGQNTEHFLDTKILPKKCWLAGDRYFFCPLFLNFRILWHKYNFWRFNHYNPPF